MSLTGFIGMGNMGYAMLKGALENIGRSNLLFSDVNEDRMKYISGVTGVEYRSENSELLAECKYIVLAVKPQYYDKVTASLSGHVTREHVFISIAPGISIDMLKHQLGDEVKVVRAMPNTPALVNEGMTGLCLSEDDFTAEEKELIFDLFRSFGKYEVVEERLMDAVVCLSGSSPAYVYMFIEALADSAVKYGIPRDKALTMAAQTVLGSAKMVLETGEHPAVLKDKVCSPGGTTIAAVSALEENGFRNAVIKAGDACYKKTSRIH